MGRRAYRASNAASALTNTIPTHRLPSRTLQEEVQYKVFSALGLDDLTIRSWFNGPALLTWSRGQNEYGNNIAGPLPRSFMRDQWNLQKRILARYRELNIDFQLPGFQANVPWALAAVLGDANITQQGDTGWMYSTDPQFARIADLWMQTLCADFGCSPTQPMQLDGYFDGGTAPWKIQGVGDSVPPRGKALPSPPAANQPPPQPRSLAGAATALPACVFSAAQPNTYLAGCDATNCAAYGTLADAQAACLADVTCGGVTQSAGGKAHYELRQGDVPQTSPDGETSWYVTNAAACRPPPPPVTPDPVWRERAVAAYAGLTRTVPNATWYFQGWAIVHWTTWQQASQFSGFVDAVPHGRFVVTDMSEDGSGEWRQWSNAGLFGAPFVWTTLHGACARARGGRGDASGEGARAGGWAGATSYRARCSACSLLSCPHAPTSHHHPKRATCCAARRLWRHGRAQGQPVARQRDPVGVRRVRWRRQSGHGHVSGGL